MRYFLAGLGIGFGTALLIAPQSGAEARGRIRRTIGGAGRRLRSSLPFDEVRERIFGLADSAHETTGASDAENRSDITELLNKISKEDLLSVHGIGPVLAERVIRYRPYRSEREILEKDVLNEQTFRNLKRELRNLAS
jgi:gas vesicle protein